MVQIVKANAIVNNEVAFLAWQTNPDPIPDCLGFHIVREYLDANGQVTAERPLAAYVAFEGQSNPDWQAQNTTVWPVQKFNWRDLTLRRHRDKLGLRPENERLRYRIRPVGRLRDGLEEVVPVPESHWDAKTKQRVEHHYQGAPIRLGYLAPAAFTNIVEATRRLGPFVSTFTNGILSSQFLIRMLEENDGKVGRNELEVRLREPNDTLRRYLAGDVPTTMTEFLSRAGGQFHAALYELEDRQLLDLLVAAAPRMQLILSDAGSRDTKDKITKKVIHTDYDTRNEKARATLRAIADAPGATFRMQNRLFNGSGHIGHNKFVVWSDDQGTPQAVLTGSTNWTWSGISGQSNNCIVIEDANVARAYLDYWQRLFDHPLPHPPQTGDANTGADQGDVVKDADRTPVTGNLANGAAFECWFSPNVPGAEQPPSARAKRQPPPPPDMDRLFSLMRRAHRMILFAVFLPSKGGVHSIISQAIDLGLADTSLQVVGAVSDPLAWGYQPSGTGPDGKPLVPSSPFIIQQGGVNVVRATALTDRDIGRQLGNFVNKEILSAGKAIIHDKILVIDPLDSQNCVVAFGSHNLGYKASYSNDENLVIVQRDPALAQAYATHVLDVFDHYRFRAAEAEKSAELQRAGVAASSSPTDGFLSIDDNWQTKADRRISAYFAK
ncbi:phospholipase D-like domain-containing protein [Mesorhizobium amorphae]|uniref:phospholipase D-like domain-containing protein n=1 Tax=Mesorhizobium amorphae TaxID=71433 RepID=UPI00177A8CCC|nr:phospholipase D-like domain-containing protein [Mesorhizobium amorphae]